MELHALQERPTLVVYLSAEDTTLQHRAAERDGKVHNEYELQARYWKELVEEVKALGIPVKELDSTEKLPPKLAEELKAKLDEMHEQEEAQRVVRRQSALPPTT